MSSAGEVSSNIGITILLTSLIAALVFLVHDCNTLQRECTLQGRVWRQESCQERTKP